MGDAKRYYYIKKKSPAGDNVSFVHEKPRVVLQPLLSGHSSKSQTRVLDMDFQVSSQPKLWLGVLRWGLLMIVAAIVYITGSLLSMSGDYVKEAIIRKGETAAANLEKGAQAMLGLDIENALRNFQLAERNFDAALGDFAALGQNNILLAKLPLDQSQLLQSQILMKSGYHLAVAGADVAKSLKPLVQYWDSMATVGGDFSEIGREVGRLLAGSSKGFDKALGEVTMAAQFLEQVNPRRVMPAYADLVAEAQSRVQTFREALEMAGVLAKRLPAAIGFDNPRYYLLLNQNPNEIRATGGFIGSYALVELYKGKLESVFVDNIHRLDGQNRYNDEELPIPLRAVTAYYGVRDANWEPNFPTSVRTIQRLYEQAGGGTVDGMIALTPVVVSDILEVLGPVFMPEYGFQLTAANFVEKTQKHVEIEAQGAYNPKQLLVDFTPILVTKLMQADAQQIDLIGKKLLRRLLTKDILAYSADSQLEDVVHALGWGGEILEIGEQDDYLYIVESNLGGNKSSGSVVRDITHHAVIHPTGAVLDDLKIVYAHQGTDVFPDGANKNYIRIYLPSGTRITRVTGYDEGTQTDTDTSDGKTVIGFWVTTAPGETSTISLEYLLPFKLYSAEAYKLVVQKQPGVSQTRLTSIVTGIDKKRQTLLSDPLIQDEVLSVTF